MTFRHLLVMNPAAGRRHGRDPAAVVAAFRRRGLAAEIVLTERRGHAREIVRERGPDFDVIVLVGGDGTLHEGIQDLDLDRNRLGIVPWGTGNDFAWSLGTPSDLEACVERIATGIERRVDVGIYEIRHAGGELRGRFHNEIGFGFEALVNAESDKVRRLKGAAVYVWALLRAVPKYRTYPVTLEWEGGGYEGMISLLAVGNGVRVGGCFRFFPRAALDDGRLDLLFAARLGLVQALRGALLVAAGRHEGRAEFRTAAASEFRISASGGIPVYVDGEFLNHSASWCRTSLRPCALRML